MKKAIIEYWHTRKRRKSFKLIKLIFASYLIIFSVLLLKNVFQSTAGTDIWDIFSNISRPIQAVSWGWLSAIVIQSATIVAIFINTLLGLNLIEFTPSIYLMIGLILGNSSTPLFATLFVLTKKHWDIRHAFEIGVANVVYSVLLAAIIGAVQMTTGLFATLGILLESSLSDHAGIRYLPTFLDVIVSPLFWLLRTDQWPFLLALVVSLALLIWAFRLFGDAVIRYSGGVKRSQKKIEEHLGSKWKAFAIGLALSVFIPSSSLLVTLLVPLAAKGILTLRRAIPFIIAVNLATFIDVLLVSFANGSSGAIAGATVLMIMMLFGIFFMFGPLGIGVIHKITRFITLKLLPQRKRSAAIFLTVYTLIPLIFSQL